jgi:hypothetical protein
MRLPIRLATFSSLCLATSVFGEEPRSDALKLGQVHEATRQLRTDVEQLQEALLSEGDSVKHRMTYRKAESALDGLDKFERSLNPKAKGAELSSQYESIASIVDGVADEADTIGGGRGALAAAVDHVRGTDAQLQFLLLAGNADETRRAAVITRQAKSLASAAMRLQRSATFALDDGMGRPGLLANLVALEKATQRFSAPLAGKVTLKSYREAFKPVDDAWRKVVVSLKRLPAAEVAAISRAAGRFDQIIGRLYRLLDLESGRPVLTTRS